MTGRTNLVTTFACKDCGQPLHLYRDDEATDAARANGTWRGHHPSSDVYSRVFVAPCRTCIEKVTGPANQLLQAIRNVAAAEPKQ